MDKPLDKEFSPELREFIDTLFPGTMDQYDAHVEELKAGLLDVDTLTDAQKEGLIAAGVATAQFANALADVPISASTMLINMFYRASMTDALYDEIQAIAKRLLLESMLGSNTQ